MKYKVSELSGALLDVAVAMAEGAKWMASPKGCLVGFQNGRDPWFFRPSTDWAHGGPIIERERRFCLQAPDALDEQLHRGSWSAIVLGSESGWCAGPTPLIAAMRAYVASKLGEEIDL